MQSIVDLAKEYERRLDDANRQISHYDQDNKELLAKVMESPWRKDVGNIPYKTRILVKYFTLSKSMINLSGGRTEVYEPRVDIAVRDDNGRVRIDNTARYIPSNDLISWMLIPR